MSGRTPPFAEVLARAFDARLEDLHVGMPARVLTYDAATLKVSAQPLIRRGYLDELGARQTELLPVIPEVPVVFPGSGAVRIRFPIAVGDTVLLLFADRSLDRWLVRGGDVDPADDRNHSMTDAIAIPGLLDFAHAANASPMIEFTNNGQIHAGGSDALAKQADLQALRNHVNALLTGGTGSAIVPAPSVGTGTTVLKGG